MIPQSAKEHAAWPLFDGFWDSSIWSALSGSMGYVVCDREKDPESAVARLADYAFLAGKPNEELLWRSLPDRGFHILVPRAGSGWDRLIEQVMPSALPTERYGLRKDTVFDRDHLARARESLAQGYRIERIDAALYDACAREEWSRDLVCHYPSFEDFDATARGFVVCRGDSVAGGSSSFSSYPGGIEVQVITHPDHRRRGIAYACSAALILSCLEDGLYASWDAANRSSLGLARKLGYTPSAPYIGYEITL